MTEYLKVENNVGLVRDIETGAILSTDSTGYQAYINNRERAMSDKQRIENLENDLSDIKSMLKELLGKTNGKLI